MLHDRYRQFMTKKKRTRCNTSAPFLKTRLYFGESTEITKKYVGEKSLQSLDGLQYVRKRYSVFLQAAEYPA